MKSIIFILGILFCTNSEGQFSKFKGIWITPDYEVLNICDSLGESNQISNSRTIDFRYSLSINNDTLFFKNSYYYQDGRTSDLYTFKVISVTDTFLEVRPLSDYSRLLFSTKERIKFKKQEYTEEIINFRKIVYHTSSCFGLCPIMDVEIDNKKNVYLKSKFYKDGGDSFGEIDSSHTGYFSGYLSNSDYNQLVHLLQTCYLNTLEFRKADCCDAPTKTFIIYYNDRRKYLSSMFPPIIVDKLISFLESINTRAILKRTKVKKMIEK